MKVFGKSSAVGEEPVKEWAGSPIDLSSEAPTLMHALIRARRTHGCATSILQDRTDPPMSYDALVQMSYALAGKIKEVTAERAAVGLLLPTSGPAVATFFSVQAAGRVAALLNHQAGFNSLRSACTLAGATTIVTSQRFLKAAHLEATAERLRAHFSVVFLEDLRDAMTAADRAVAFLRSRLANLLQQPGRQDEVAAILFTSGTTGAPKGVALSHANILANIAQCRAHAPLDPNWVFFSALPIFHAFGLTCGALLPILSGMKVVFHPSPLDRHQIPTIITETGASVLVSTDTFARHYARAALPNTLASLRYAVLGGEKVSDRTIALFSAASPAQILEGYGVTECAPVVALNQPGSGRRGTVGKLLPGMAARLEPVPGVSVGGRLLLRGPNVMLGYLDPTAPGGIETIADEWFDTGDLALVDKDGFISITGRIKRFAKIGAELVSLAAVEETAAALWPENRHAAVAIDRTDGGEAIVLVTDHEDASRTDFAAWAQANNASALEVPDHVLTVARLPTLATGKPDYERTRRITKRTLRKSRTHPPG